MTKVIGRKGMHVFDITKNGIVKMIITLNMTQKGLNRL